MAEHMPERMPERIKRWLRTEWLWRAYANRLHTQWQKNYLWILVEPYRRPRSFLPFISVNIAAFYTGVVGAAIKEQLYKYQHLGISPNRVYQTRGSNIYAAQNCKVCRNNLWGNIDTFRKCLEPKADMYGSVDTDGSPAGATHMHLDASGICVNVLASVEEKYWEEHPGEAVPMMKPSFYWGPWRVQREDFKEP